MAGESGIGRSRVGKWLVGVVVLAGVLAVFVYFVNHDGQRTCVTLYFVISTQILPDS